MPGENEIEIVIRAQNLFSAELRALAGEVRNVASSVSTIDQKFAPLQSTLKLLLEQHRQLSRAANEESASTVRGIDAKTEAYKRLQASLSALKTTQVSLPSVEALQPSAAASLAPTGIQNNAPAMRAWQQSAANQDEIFRKQALATLQSSIQRLETPYQEYRQAFETFYEDMLRQAKPGLFGQAAGGTTGQLNIAAYQTWRKSDAGSEIDAQLIAEAHKKALAATQDYAENAKVTLAQVKVANSRIAQSLVDEERAAAERARISQQQQASALAAAQQAEGIRAKARSAAEDVYAWPSGRTEEEAGQLQTETEQAQRAFSTQLRAYGQTLAQTIKSPLFSKLTEELKATFPIREHQYVPAVAAQTIAAAPATAQYEELVATGATTIRRSSPQELQALQGQLTTALKTIDGGSDKTKAFAAELASLGARVTSLIPGFGGLTATLLQTQNALDLSSVINKNAGGFSALADSAMGLLRSITPMQVGLAAAGAGVMVLMSSLKTLAEIERNLTRDQVAFNEAVLRFDAGPMIQTATAMSRQINEISETYKRGLSSVGGFINAWNQFYADAFSVIKTGGKTTTGVAEERMVQAAKEYVALQPKLLRKEELSGTERLANLRASEARYTLYEVQGLESLRSVQEDITTNYAAAHQARMSQLQMETQAAMNMARQHWQINQQGEAPNQQFQDAYALEIRLLDMRKKQAQELSQAEQAVANQRRDRMIEARRRDIETRPIELDIAISKASIQVIQSEISMLQARLADTAASGVEAVLGRILALTKKGGQLALDELELQRKRQIYMLQQPETPEQLIRQGVDPEIAKKRAEERKKDYEDLKAHTNRMIDEQKRGIQAQNDAAEEAAKIAAENERRQRASFAAQTPAAIARNQQALAATQRQFAQAQTPFATPETYEDITKSINQAAEAEYAWAQRAIFEEFRVAWNAERNWDKKAKIALDYYNNLQQLRERNTVDEDARNKQSLELDRQMRSVQSERALARLQTGQQITGVQEQVARTQLQLAGPETWQMRLGAVTALSGAGAAAQLDVYKQQYDLALRKAKTTKEEEDAWLAFKNQYDLWSANEIARAQALEQLALDTRKKFQIDQPAQLREMEFRVGDINLATNQIEQARAQLAIRDIDLLPLETQEAVVRRTDAMIVQMADQWRAGDDYLTTQRRAAQEADLRAQAALYKENASFYLKQIDILHEQWRAEDAQKAQRYLLEDEQRHQEHLARLRQLYESTPLFQGISRQLEQFQSDVEMVLGDIMTGEFKSWADEWNKIWKAMARNAAKYLADELFQPVKEGWKKMTNDVVTEADKTGRPVTQGGFGLMLEGVKNIWNKLFGPKKEGYGGTAGDWGEPVNAGDIVGTAGASADAFRTNALKMAESTEDSFGPMTSAMTTFSAASQGTISTWAATTEGIFASWMSQSLAIFQTMAANSGGGGAGGLGGLTGMFSGAQGGAGGGAGTYNVANWATQEGAIDSGFIGFATGGHITKPTVGLVGEAGPELILPLTKPAQSQKLLESVGLAYQPIKKFAEGGVVGSVGGTQQQTATDALQAQHRQTVAASGQSAQALRALDVKKFAEGGIVGGSADAGISAGISQVMSTMLSTVASMGGVSLSNTQAQEAFAQGSIGLGGTAPGGMTAAGSQLAAGIASGRAFGAWDTPSTRAALGISEDFGGGIGGPGASTTLPAVAEAYYGGKGPLGTDDAAKMDYLRVAFAAGDNPELEERLQAYYKSLPKFAEGGLVGGSPSQATREILDANRTAASLDSTTPLPLRPTGSLGPAGSWTSLSTAQRTSALVAIGGSTSAGTTMGNFRVWNGTIYVRTQSGGWTPITAAEAKAVYGVTVGDTEGGGGGADQGAGKGGRGSRGSDAWGGLSASQAKNVAQAGLMTGAWQGVAAAFGIAALGYGATMLGVEPGFDPFGGLRAADIQDMRDIQGAFAAESLSAQRAAVEQSVRDIEAETWGPAVAESMTSGGTPGGWGSSPTAPESTIGPMGSQSPMDATQPGGISMEGGRASGGVAGSTTTDPGFGGYGRGDLGYGNAPNMGGGGPGGPGGADMGSGQAGDQSQGAGTGASDRARGGVQRATRPTRVRFGEGGEPETAVFIPEHMKQPGMQGPEETAVIDTMIRALAKLTGRDVEEIATPMAEGGIVTRKTLALIGEKGPEAVVPLRRGASSAAPARTAASPAAPPRPTDTVTPGRASDTTIINVFREEDFQAAMAAAVARGSKVITNDIIAGLAGNRAIRRSIQRTS